MKKKIIVLTFIICLVVFVACLYVYKDNDTAYKNITNNNLEEEIINSNSGISMMYETGPNTGKYSESKSSLWPENGYIYNGDLSRCENGGILSWDSTTNKITLLNNISDKCYVYFDTYIIPTINNVVASNITSNSITLTVNTTNGDNQITNYYFSNGGDYIDNGNTNTYTFNNLTPGTEYNFSVYVEDSAKYKSEVYNLSATTSNPILLADYIKNTVYQGDGVNGLYYHDGSGSYTNTDQEAGDNSYRYAGANPNNYICFGSNAVTCPSDNLYRIIGAFDDDSDGLYEVKLIKSTNASSTLLGEDGAYDNDDRYYWNNDTGTNIWSESNLNKINLNTNFLNAFSYNWKNIIAINEWYVDGYSERAGSVKLFYEAENSGEVYDAKIGLMYVSDYGYAADPTYWTTDMQYYDYTNGNNWMLSLNGVFITRYIQTNNNYVFMVNTAQGNGITYGRVTGSFRIFPSFYLTSSTQYISGTGTQSDPFRIVV